MGGGREDPPPETRLRQPSPERIEEDRPKRLHPESDSDAEDTTRPNKVRAHHAAPTAPHLAKPEDLADGEWITPADREKEKKARRQEKKAEASSPPQPQTSSAGNLSSQPRSNAPRRTLSLAMAPRTTPQGTAFKISPTTDWTAYEVVETLQDDATLSFSARPGREGIFVLYPKDEATTNTLQNLTSLQGKPVRIQQLAEPGQKPTKGVVMGFPHGLPLTLLTKEEKIMSATRCTYGKSESKTRQVIIEHEGPLPGKLDLGVWGVFYIRPYSQEPLRCYNCQAFGHGISRCRQQTRCGICSENHETRQCLQKYKANQAISAKCPNCQGDHHAWNKMCPARLARVEKAKEGQARWVETHCEAPPGTFVWGSQRSSQASQPLSQEDFPALPNTLSRQHPAGNTQHSAPAPPPSTPKEPVVTLTAKGLKSLLSGLIVSIAKLLKGDTEEQALDAVVDSLVAQALQVPHKTTPAPVQTQQQLVVPQTAQQPPSDAISQTTPDAEPSTTPQEPAAAQTPTPPPVKTSKRTPSDSTPAETTSEEPAHPSQALTPVHAARPTSPAGRTKKHKKSKVCKRQMKLALLHRECCASSMSCNGTSRGLGAK